MRRRCQVRATVECTVEFEFRKNKDNAVGVVILEDPVKEAEVHRYTARA